MIGGAGLRMIGLACVALGTLGLVVPLLPGPVLIWAGATTYAVGDRFVEVGWPTIITLGALALSAEVAERGSRRCPDRPRLRDAWDLPVAGLSHFVTL